MTPTLITLQDAPPFSADGTSVTGYAAPSRGTAAVSMWRIELDPGTSSPMHRLDVEEVFLGLGGRGYVLTDGQEWPVGDGDCLVVPPHTPFRVCAGDHEPFKAVVCMPAGGQATLLPDGPTFVPPWAE